MAGRLSSGVSPHLTMRVLVIIAANSLLAGCMAYGPLKSDPSSRGVGYSEEQLSATSYLVRYDGRRDQSYHQLRPLLIRRAGELCSGSFSLSEYTHASGFVIHSLKAIWPYVTAKVKCTEPPIDKEVRFGEDEV